MFQGLNTLHHKPGFILLGQQTSTNYPHGTASASRVNKTIQYNMQPKASVECPNWGRILWRNFIGAHLLPRYFVCTWHILVD